MEIVDATETQLPGILHIYNQVIESSTAIYRDEPASLEDRARWWSDRLAQGYPVLVARHNLEILGFSSFGDFRPWPGYRYTVEHTVHVRADQRGKGIGRHLVEALFPRARELGKHVMIGAVDAENEPSIRFHVRLGFELGGRLREVGFKFGRWLDLALLQKNVE